MTRMTIERSLKHKRPAYICFVDYEKAFDRINWTKLMNILKDIGVNWRDRILIKEICVNQTTAVRVESILSEFYTTVWGSGRGCCLSPLMKR